MTVSTLAIFPRMHLHMLKWWSSRSMAGLVNILGTVLLARATSPLLASATKHWDEVYVSRYYNWHSGGFKNGYTHASAYQLKPSADKDAMDTLSKNPVVPLLEKQLADGNTHEYEIDEQAIHTEAPGLFLIVYIASSPEGLDMVNAAAKSGAPAFFLPSEGVGKPDRVVFEWGLA